MARGGTFCVPPRASGTGQVGTPCHGISLALLLHLPGSQEARCVDPCRIEPCHALPL